MRKEHKQIAYFVGLRGWKVRCIKSWALLDEGPSLCCWACPKALIPVPHHIPTTARYVTTRGTAFTRLPFNLQFHSYFWPPEKCLQTEEMGWRSPSWRHEEWEHIFRSKCKERTCILPLSSDSVKGTPCQENCKINKTGLEWEKGFKKLKEKKN